jgi:hypothetical protein
MRLQLLVCLALVAMVCAQTPQPPSPMAPAGTAPGAAPQANAPDAPEPPKVNADDPVITIKGFCADSTLKGDACKTVITKAEFEKLADSIQPGMAAPMRRQFATRYSQVLTMSSEAEKRGLDKTPHFEDSLRLARMQILAQELTKALQTDANNVSDQDVQDYYQKNVANYEQATFVKIFVPHTKRVIPPPAPAKTAAKDGSSTAAAKLAAKQLSPEEQEKAGAEAMKKEASLLRERLVKGEDPDKLEKAAFTAAGLPGNPPPTKMEKVRRTSLPASQQSAMELKVDEVSQVISDASGNYIYKLVSKETLPVDSVKTEIHNQLSAQRYRETMQHFQSGAELNDAYFGSARGPGMPMPPRGNPGAPAKDNDRD